MMFWLGTHQPSWLSQTDVPLFVSHTRLKRYKTLPVALGPWALDSGAFSEIATHGRFQTAPGVYAKAVKRYSEEVGKLAWCAPQDWMCEPVALKRTGYTIKDHQWLTIQSYLELIEYELTVIPVLQGQTVGDYLRHVDLYERNGIQLTALPLVGLGSVCRRQHTLEIETIVARLRYEGLSLHGFGVKTKGLERYIQMLTSSDSMAWSFDARYSLPLPECRHGFYGTGNCANCLRYALRWRERLLSQLP